MCGIASFELWKILKKKKIESFLIRADGHVYIQVLVKGFGYINVDITATQFSNKLPKVLMFKDRKELFKKYPDVVEDNEERWFNCWYTGDLTPIKLKSYNKIKEEFLEWSEVACPREFLDNPITPLESVA
jgi:hypothetical protein